MLLYLLISEASTKKAGVKEIYRSYSYDIYRRGNRDDNWGIDGTSFKGEDNILLLDLTNNADFQQKYKNIVKGHSVYTYTPPLDEFILKKEKEHGSYLFDVNFILGAKFVEEPVPYTNFTMPKAVALFNGDPIHSLFVSLGLVLNTMVHHSLDDSFNIKFGVYPIDKEGDSELYLKSLDSTHDSFYVGLFAGIGFSLTTSQIVFYLLTERNSGVKHLHALSGVSMKGYWLPTFVWDLMYVMLPVAGLYPVFFLFDKPQFTEEGNWLLVIVVMLLYAWAGLVANYAFHFVFHYPTSGLAGVVVLNMFMTVLSCLVSTELNGPKGENPLRGAGLVLDWVFSAFIPSYNLAQCFSYILYNFDISNNCRDYVDTCEKGKPSLCCNMNKTICTSPIPDARCFRWSENSYNFEKGQGIGSYMAFLAIQGCVGMIAVILIEAGMTGMCCAPKAAKQAKTKDDEGDKRSRKSAKNKNAQTISLSTIKASTVNDLCRVGSVGDIDVYLEQERVKELDPSQRPLMMVHLTKKYGPKVAVDKLYVSVTEGECFGLLGQNGAGKTTIFRMLTGQTGISQGTAFISGYSVRTQLKKVQHEIGYCPQYDAHLGDLTGVETLTMYAHLCGIPGSQIPVLVTSLIQKVLLGQSAERRCGGYSGGNRRKLSLAMALISSPKFLFLDEPSAGMDPKARRQMWNVLSDIRAEGCTIVLTSHSMEECEALCTNLAILLNGRFMCLGSPQHLKTKYGQGYTIIVKLSISAETDATAQLVVDYLAQHIQNIAVFDQHPGYLHLHVPDASVNIADVFSTMEACKAEFDLEDYSVLETSLEQIFLSLTKHYLKDAEPPEKGYNCWFLRSGFFDDNNVLYKCIGWDKEERPKGSKSDRRSVASTARSGVSGRPTEGIPSYQKLDPDVVSVTMDVGQLNVNKDSAVKSNNVTSVQSSKLTFDKSNIRFGSEEKTPR